MFGKLLVLLFVGIMAGVGLATPPRYYYTWETLPTNMPMGYGAFTPPHVQGVYFTNTIWVWSGYTGSWSNEVWKFTVTTDGSGNGTWTQMPSLPIPMGQAAYVAHLGNIFSIGGHGTAGATYWINEPHPEFGWQVGATHPKGEVIGGTAVSYAGSIYVIGGGLGVHLSSFSNVYMGNGISGWTEVSPLNARRLLAPAVVYSNKIYVAGGIQDGSMVGTALSSVERYDGVSWTYTTPLPKPLYNGRLIVINNKIYYFGSEDESDYYVNTNTYIFDGTSWSTSSVPLSKDGWYDHGACFGYINPLIYALGGHYDGESYAWYGYELTNAPQKATNPVPAHLAVDQSVNIGSITWSSLPIEADAFNVYFGETPSPGIGQFKGSQTNNTYAPGLLEYAHDYYWRIDTTNSLGTAVGDVWRFDTWSSPPGTASKLMVVNSWDDGPIGPAAIPASLRWAAVAGTPYARSGPVVGVVSNKLYAFGVYGSGTPFTNVYSFNGTSWTEVPGLPTAKSSCVGGSLNNVFYVVPVDGSSGYGFNGVSWSSIPAAPYIGFRGGAATYSNKLYVVGGGTGGAVHCFDGAIWTTGPATPISFVGNGVAVLSNKLYTIAGRTLGGGFPPITNVYRLDGTNWTSVTGFPEPGITISSAGYSNKIYSTAGDTAEIYTFNGTTWSSSYSLPQPAYWRELAVFSNKLYAVQGEHGGTYQTNVYYLTTPE